MSENISAKENITASDNVRVKNELDAPSVREVEVDYKDGKIREKKQHDDKPAFHKSLVREYFESAVVTLIMALFGMTFIVQAVKVPTGSMKNTIWVQDHLLVDKYIFGSQSLFNLPIFPARDVRRGDVVVFKYPRTPDVNYVKRVIGLPGETVEFDSAKNSVYINGQPLAEQRVFVKPPKNDPDFPGDVLVPVQEEAAPTGANWKVYYDERYRDEPRFDHEMTYGVRQPFKIPVKGDPIPEEIKSDPDLNKFYDADNDGKYDSDQYFCMGDNRDDSLDSRFWGTVPRAAIVGRAMVVYWSVDKSREGSGHFFSRWWRTGTLIK